MPLRVRLTKTALGGLKKKGVGVFRFASTSIARKALVALLTILVAAVIAPSALGTPYHTPPTPSSVDSRYGWCDYWFWNPTEVYGFAYEYVYWRPIAAEPNGNQWQYRYGEWKRAITTENGMTTGWYSQQWPDNEWLPSPRKSVVTVSSGPNRWLGYQIYYGSNHQTYTGWLFNGSANC